MKRAARVRDRQDDLAFGGEDSGFGVDGVDAVTVDEEFLGAHAGLHAQRSRGGIEGVKVGDGAGRTPVAVHI
ncbi:MAG: hypothetical protein VCE12_22400 [Candidatus Latescibacterota bacterium]